MMAVSKFLFNDVLYMFLFVSKLPRVQVNDRAVNLSKRTVNAAGFDVSVVNPC